MSLLASTALRRASRTQQPGSSSSSCVEAADRCGQRACAPSPRTDVSTYAALLTFTSTLNSGGSLLMSQEPPGQVWASSNPLLPSSPACLQGQAQNSTGNIITFVLLCISLSPALRQEVPPVKDKVPTCSPSQEEGNEEGGICLSSFLLRSCQHAMNTLKTLRLQIKKTTHSNPQHQLDKTNLGSYCRHSYFTPHQ